jgi:amino acid adenylation domain-containing protein
MSEVTTLDELKHRARSGDVQALQELRDRGFFRGNKPRPEGDPVSHAQRRLWIVDQMVEGFGAYNLPVALQLEGTLDVDALRAGFKAIIRRHESLRTTFGTIQGEVRQFVHEELATPWYQIDLSDDPHREVSARQLAAHHASEPFNLAKGPLLRAALVRLAIDRHLFLFNIHHIVSDLVSLGVLVRELSCFYDAFASGREAELPPLAVQYRDFAAWQNRLIGGEEAARHCAYWHRQLAGPLPPLELPIEFARPQLKTYRGSVGRAVLDPGLTDRLRQLGLRHGMTLFMALTASVKVLLHRYTGQDEIIVGSPLAGRDHPDLADQIGCFVNTVVLRDRLGPDDPFSQVLRRVRQTMLEAYEHQVYPFDKLVEELDLPRDMRRSPVFDVSVSLMNTEPEELRFGDVRITAYDDEFASSKVDLSFDFCETGDGLELAIAYCRDLFRAERIRSLADHFVRLTAAAVEDPDRPIGFLPLLFPEEQHRILVELNRTGRPVPHDKTFVDLFEQHAEEMPHAVAVTFEGRELTYQELNRRANQLGHLLKQYGVGAEVMVGSFMEPSDDVVVGVLGILKAGGVYVPLDPANPFNRLAGMLEDSGPPVVLTQESLADRLPAMLGSLVLCLDEARGSIASQSEDNLSRQAGPENAAYVIYTSGSTGRPKGTVLLHRGLLNVITEQARLFNPGHGDRVLQFASLGFDASVFEMVMGLGSGAILFLSPREQLQPGPALLATLKDGAITILTIPPSALAVLDETELPELRVITVAGEACPTDLFRRWAPGRAFFNLYGPTETTIWATQVHCDPDDRVPTIGRPISNTRVYILDQQRQPVPLGVAGELCIAGIGLARHYLHRPDLTAARFVPDPFDNAPGSRLYLTGDRARYLPDGSIQFLGRIDHQVKLRGYRIEPGEIEAALGQHPLVREAVVLAREGESGSQQLVAYVRFRDATPPPDARRLRQFLQERLPEYMVPAIFIALDEIPMSASRKVDRGALPAPDGAAPNSLPDFVEPRDDLEWVLSAFFAEVLRAQRVGIDDNFFDLGGDSLLATQILSRLTDTLSTPISIPQLFRAGTIRSLTAVVRDASPNGRADRIAIAVRRVQSMSAQDKQELLERKLARDA